LDDIRATIAGGTPLPQSREKPTSRKVNLIIDIQEKLKNGKGPAYEHWAKVYNLKQMAEAVQYLQEHNLLEYSDLETMAEQSVDRFHELAGRIQNVETAIQRNSDLRSAVTDYARTRPIFEEYKAKKYSRKYLAEHENEISDYRAAQASLRTLLDGQRLPKMDTLKAESRKLASERKSLYTEYRTAQKDMREAIAVKSNIDHLLGITGGREHKEQER
jgi:hypothetical protein